MCSLVPSPRTALLMLAHRAHNYSQMNPIMRNSRLTQVSIVIITILLLLVFLIYLKQRNHSHIRAKQCSSPTPSNGPAQEQHKNGFIATPSKCCDAVRGKDLEQMCIHDNKRGAKLAKNDSMLDGCSCEDFFLCKLVIVSAISSNHMAEATEMIISVQEHMPNTRLIMYSLGLTDKEMALLRSYCNLELRTFDFDRYPAISYSRHNLRKYGWKPVIVNEVASEYDVILWFDSSIRLSRPIDKKVFKYLQSTPAFLTGPWIGKRCLHSNDPIVSYTHDQTLKYLFPNKSQDLKALRKELVVWGHMQSGICLMWLKEDMRKTILKNWVDCALHEECMAPRDAVVDCNPAKRWFIRLFSPEGQYIDCHRYDQSSLDMILYREFGVSSANTICHDFVFDLFLIARDSQRDERTHLFQAVVLVSIVIIIVINWYFR